MKRNHTFIKHVEVSLIVCNNGFLYGNTLETVNSKTKINYWNKKWAEKEGFKVWKGWVGGGSLE